METERRGANCLTSLEPLETFPDALREQTAAQLRLHAAWAEDRKRIVRALENSRDEKLMKRAERLGGCCQCPEIRRGENGKPSIRLNCCRDRMCPRCQRQRGANVMEKVESIVQKFAAARFVTLTLQHRDESLDEMRKRLARGFAKVRNEPGWKMRVKAGVWVIETTRNAKTQRWHVHLHLVIDGDYFPQKVLSKMWLTATGDSCVCDIRAIHDRRRVAKYIADYVAKPVDMGKWPADAICEFAAAMAGVRMVHTFGKAHGANLGTATPTEESKPSQFVIHAVVLRRLAADGNLKAQFAVTTLAATDRVLCESLGQRWERGFNAPRLVSDEDVAHALRVCEELERGILIDPPPRHEPTREELESEQLFPDRCV